MKKVIASILISFLVLSTGCSTAKDSSQKPQNTNAGNSNNTSNQSSTGVKDNNTKPADIDTKKAVDVTIYLIAIDDNGKSGKKLETGDSIVPIKRTIADSNAPLKDTLSLLFSLKDRFYGESGLYNSLYQSNLKVDSAKIENGIATIKLSGNLMLGGVMDNPRVKAQITETALQFSTIKEVRIFINDKTIDEALSLK
jgi:spore germination protein GerM